MKPAVWLQYEKNDGVDQIRFRVEFTRAVSLYCLENDMHISEKDCLYLCANSFAAKMAEVAQGLTFETLQAAAFSAVDAFTTPSEECHE